MLSCGYRLLICSMLGRAWRLAFGLGMGLEWGKVILRDVSCSQVNPGFIYFFMLLREARIHQ